MKPMKKGAETDMFPQPPPRGTRNSIGPTPLSGRGPDAAFVCKSNLLRLAVLREAARTLARRSICLHGRALSTAGILLFNRRKAGKAVASAPVWPGKERPRRTPGNGQSTRPAVPRQAAASEQVLWPAGKMEHAGCFCWQKAHLCAPAARVIARMPALIVPGRPDRAPLGRGRLGFPQYPPGRLSTTESAGPVLALFTFA
jgi:hypothetical protein